jgi:hypothetical protein
LKEILYNIRKSNGSIETKSITVIPKQNDIVFRKLFLIYVLPILNIEIQSNTITYRRRAFAASKTMTIDEIAIYSKDLYTLKIGVKKKSTRSVCETYGIAFCIDHIHKHNKKWYYKDHIK